MNDIELNYTLTENDYRRFNFIYVKIYFIPFAFVLPIIGVLVQLMPSNSYLRTNFDLIRLFSYYLANFIPILPILILCSVILIWRSHVIFKQDKELSMPRQITFSDVSLTETTEISKFQLDYADICKVRCTKKLLVIFVSAIRGILVPINDENEQSVRQVCKLLAEKGVKIK